MRHGLGLALVSVVILVSGGFWAHAQGQPPNGPRVLPSPRVAPAPGQESQAPTVISGGDFGFRVDRWDGDTPVGRVVVRHDGKWVDVRIPASAQRLTGR
jgi:hypothetical protein